MEDELVQQLSETWSSTISSIFCAKPKTELAGMTVGYRSSSASADKAQSAEPSRQDTDIAFLTSMDCDP